MVCLNSIYDKLEIKDYIDIFEFLDEVNDRNTLSQKDDAVIIYGSREFIYHCIVQLANIYGYKLGFVSLYYDDNTFGDICDDGEFVLIVGFDGNDNIIHSIPVRIIDDNLQRRLLNIPLVFNYIRTFINQDCVEQDLVDACLNSHDEVMLFGICSSDDKSNKSICCNESCPWFEECI